MKRRSFILYIPATTFALPQPLLTSPLPDRLTAGSDPWLFAYSAERRSLYMRVSGCVYIFSLYMCACVQERLCTVNMCLNCQQREYTAKNKNSSVSIQWVCVCVCVAIFCACSYVSLCYSIWSWARDGEVYLVAVNGDKRHRGGWGREELKCHMWRNLMLLMVVGCKQ